MNCIFDIDIYCYRKAFVQLRMDELPLNCNVYRYSDVHEAKVCPWCSNSIEDIVHFLKECPQYEGLRRKICPYVSFLPINELLNGKNKRTTLEVAKYTFLSMKYRNSNLNKYM